MSFSAAIALLCAVLPVWQEPRFTVVGAGDTGRGAVIATQEAVERGLQRLQPLFPGAPSRAFQVFVHESVVTLPENVRAWLHPGAPGAALLGSQEIHLILDETGPGRSATLQGVVDHELVHILLHQFAGPRAAGHIPRWIHEGLAQDLSGDTYLGAREEDLIAPARFDNLLTFGSLVTDFPRGEFRLRQAYAQSFSFVAYLGRELGREVLLEIAGSCSQEVDFSRAFVRKTGQSRAFYEEQWIDYLENDSGAAERVVLQNCFSYLMILAAPVLALAVIRRLARDRRARDKLLAAEAEEDRETPSG